MSAINTIIFIKKNQKGRVVEEIIEIQGYNKKSQEYIIK